MAKGKSSLVCFQLEEQFENTKGAIRIRISKKTDNTTAKRKRTKGQNNNLQKITHKTKDRVTRIPLKIGGELGCYGRHLPKL